jgi:hypothetical protein
MFAHDPLGCGRPDLRSRTCNRRPFNRTTWFRTEASQPQQELRPRAANRDIIGLKLINGTHTPVVPFANEISLPRGMSSLRKHFEDLEVQCSRNW